MEKEFYNANVQKFLKKHNINHYSTYSIIKANVVERFNHTLKNDMWKQFTHNGNYIIINGSTCYRVSYLQCAKASNYRYVHRYDTIADKLLNYVYSSVKAVALPEFKVDNSVCVSKFKTIFEKGLHAKLNHGGI